MTGLAIDGGSPAFTIEEPEGWDRPIERQQAAAAELIDAGELTGAGHGRPKAFEEAFTDTVDAEYCLSVDHGSTALASAYYAVGVGPGDEVITPAAGYLGAYAGALHMGGLAPCSRKRIPTRSSSTRRTSRRGSPIGPRPST